MLTDSGPIVRVVVETAEVQPSGGVAGKRRQRELAGHARSGSFARFKARTQQQAFVRANWRLFSAFSLIGIAVCVAAAWSMPNAFLSGVVIGGGVVALPGALWILTTQMTGTVPIMMGVEAEQWTADALRRLTRRGWRLVNHVALKREDIDHVLLGPGGAYTVETKWSSSWSSSYGRDRIADGIAQARENARDLALWHEFKSLGVAPEPLLVLWGGGLSGWAPEEQIRELDGVTVVVGTSLADWTSGLTSDALTADQVARGWSALEDHMGRRDPLEREMYPVPMSAAEWAARLGLVVGLVAVGLTAFVQLISFSQSVATTAILTGVALVPVVPFLRSPRWRWAAWSWTLGIGLPAVALLAAKAVALAG